MPENIKLPADADSPAPESASQSINVSDVLGRLVLLPADAIQINADPNRDERAYRDEAYELLKESIDATKGNLQPVEVRLRREPDGRLVYELMSGHRRHHACQELGLNLRAVVTEDVDDHEAYLHRMSENALCEVLSPYERGLQIEHAFQRGVFTRESTAARTMGVDKSDLNKLRRLGQLAPRLMAAFRDPRELRVRDAKPLTDAMTKDPQAVLMAADQIARLEEKPAAKEVIAALLAAASKGGVGRTHDTTPELPLTCDGREVGRIRTGRGSTVTIDLDGPIAASERKRLARLLETFVCGRVLKLKPTRTQVSEDQQ